MIHISYIFVAIIAFLFGCFVVAMSYGNTEINLSHQCDYAGRIEVAGVVYECHRDKQP